MSRALLALEDRLDRLGRALMGWRAWAGALVSLAVAVVLVSWLFWPADDGTVALLGMWSLPPCGVLVETGLPCSQCGMTRSWVWAARGSITQAVAFNPAGFALWVWLVAGGLLGAVRLVTNCPRLVRLGWPWLAFSGLLWVLLLLIGHQLRLAGRMPLL